MSILDKGRTIEDEKIVKEIVEAMKSFYTDENLPQKSDLSIFQIGAMAKLDYRVRLEREVFGYDSKLDNDVVMAVERRNVSHERKGRTEAMNTFTAQFEQLARHPRDIFKRMFGVD